LREDNQKKKGGSGNAAPEDRPRHRSGTDKKGKKGIQIKTILGKGTNHKTRTWGGVAAGKGGEGRHGDFSGANVFLAEKKGGKSTSNSDDLSFGQLPEKAKGGGGRKRAKGAEDLPKITKKPKMTPGWSVRKRMVEHGQAIPPGATHRNWGASTARRFTCCVKRACEGREPGIRLGRAHVGGADATERGTRGSKAYGVFDRSAPEEEIKKKNYGKKKKEGKRRQAKKKVSGKKTRGLYRAPLEIRGKHWKILQTEKKEKNMYQIKRGRVERDARTAPETLLDPLEGVQSKVLSKMGDKETAGGEEGGKPLEGNKKGKKGKD